MLVKMLECQGVYSLNESAQWGKEIVAASNFNYETNFWSLRICQSKPMC